jgi:hypothetical protein
MTTSGTARMWEVRFDELAPVVIVFAIPKTRAEVLAQHPAAIDAQALKLQDGFR